MAKEGDILGYRALLSGEKYSGSATALDESSICFIPKETFLKHPKERPFVMMSAKEGTGNKGTANEGTGNKGTAKQGTGNQGTAREGAGNLGSARQGMGNFGVRKC